MGKQGSVSWNFEQKAIYTVLGEGVEEDALMEVALEVGADDIENNGETWSVSGPPDTFAILGKALTEAGFTLDGAEVVYVPNTRVMLEPDAARKMIVMIEAIEDLDDIQSATANADIPDEVLAELGA